MGFDIIEINWVWYIGNSKIKEYPFNLLPDLEVVVEPVSLAARNYHSWQKLFNKNCQAPAPAQLAGFS